MPHLEDPSIASQSAVMNARKIAEADISPFSRAMLSAEVTVTLLCSTLLRGVALKGVSVHVHHTVQSSAPLVREHGPPSHVDEEGRG